RAALATCAWSAGVLAGWLAGVRACVSKRRRDAARASRRDAGAPALQQLLELSVGHHHRGRVRVLEHSCCRDERSEQWMGCRRPRLVLRMELTSEEPGVILEFDDLDEFSVRRFPGYAKSFFFQRRDVFGIRFVAMTMPFLDEIGPVCLAGDRAFLQVA